MKTVRELAAEIVAREGGYVDDPSDPGGATKHGVTIGTMRRLGLDLTGDGKVDAEDVRRLTPDRAEAIFIEHYFQKPGIATLPDVLQPTVFDMFVNAGANAVKVLQYLLQDMGQDVEADGRIGPRTRSACEAALLEAGDLLADAYAIARRNYYYMLADSRPASRKYARRKDGGKGGWITRAEDFMQPRFRLTEAQHRERTSAWV
jgi:lysozyme family protein